MFNYTGNKGSTQAPASAPAAGAAPVLALPTDLVDPDSVATVLQAFKALADYANFEQAPFANASQFAQAIRAFFDAKGNQRWTVDHWGMPKHQLMQWVENWTPASVFTAIGATTGGPVAAARWSIEWASETTGSGGNPIVFSYAPGAALLAPPVVVGTNAPNAQRQLLLAIDPLTANNRAELRFQGDYVTSVFADDTLTSIDFDVQLATVLDILWVVGNTNTAEHVNNIQNGCYFVRPAGAGQNWHARSVVGGVQTDVDTGVLADTSRRVLRIEQVGASMADDSQAHALFYVDGVKKADITTNLPINAGIPVIPVFGGVVQSAVASAVMLMNTIRYSQIARAATV